MDYEDDPFFFHDDEDEFVDFNEVCYNCRLFTPYRHDKNHGECALDGKEISEVDTCIYWEEIEDFNG